MSRSTISYRDAIMWLVCNDDNSYIIDATSHYEFVPLSVTASAIADIYGKEDHYVLRDIRGALGLRKPRRAEFSASVFNR